MSDHGTHHDSDNPVEPGSKTAFRSSFWVVIILVGLFIAALNFINVMGHDSSHKNHEATSNETLKGESGLGREDEDTTQFHSPVTASDTILREGHN